MYVSTPSEEHECVHTSHMHNHPYDRKTTHE